MIEIRNSSCEIRLMDEETGLPVTTKAERQEHGFGIPNIRKVAEQYYGGIDIKQDENSFLLSILLLLD